MNEHIDPAFAPMDEAAKQTSGPQSDGTVTYQIVEGDQYINGQKVSKEPEVVGYVQLDREAVEAD